MNKLQKITTYQKTLLFSHLKKTLRILANETFLLKVLFNQIFSSHTNLCSELPSLNQM